MNYISDKNYYQNIFKFIAKEDTGDKEATSYLNCVRKFLKNEFMATGCYLAPAYITRDLTTQTRVTLYVYDGFDHFVFIDTGDMTKPDFEKHIVIKKTNDFDISKLDSYEAIETDLENVAEIVLKTIK